MLLEALLGLVDHPEDLGIAGDDHQAGYDKGRDEERRLAAVSMVIGHNGAGLQAGIVPKATPFPQQSGQLHAIGEEPAGGDHHGDPVALVDPGIAAMMRDHHVAIDGDHGDAKEGYSNIPVLDEWDEATEYRAMTPGALDEA